MGNVDYDSDRVLSEYLLFHYGLADEILSTSHGPKEGLGFPVRTVSELLDSNSLTPSSCRALDLGCAVGRSSFELARNCTDVVALDYSATFIRAAKTLRDSGELSFGFPSQGERKVLSVARVPSQVDSSRVRFLTEDACHLPGDLGDFDVVHAANLLCRLPDPGALIERLPELVRPGGQLLLATPFTWLEEFTPMEKWLGGRLSGKDSAEVLKKVLSPKFCLELEVDLPFLLREHERKFQYGISYGTRWRRLSV
ncbi:MAG: putative 4-mercaptohistidine N1-methyltransferase [Opitutae bacterium]|nr:putative 4-mercaptohistidine N1-methyltransferase [Opitutae bacterium]